MDKTIFDFTDYRAFLEAQIYRSGRAQRGSLSAFAAAIPCQVSYVARVMNEKADFSEEQADSVGRYFGMNSDESYFLLLLVQLARAGSHSLRAQLKKRISMMREECLNIQKRVGIEGAICKQDQSIYYGHWYYAAVHVMSGIPELQTKKAMSKELGLPSARITEILEFLISLGLVRETSDGKYPTGTGRIHLKNDSPMLLQHHTNWRLQAIRAFENNPRNGIHYSVLLNTSRSDAEKLRGMIIQFIEEFMKVVNPSPDEEMNCLSLDFFNPNRREL